MKSILHAPRFRRVAEFLTLCPLYHVSPLPIAILVNVKITLQLLLAWLCLFGDQCLSFTLY